MARAAYDRGTTLLTGLLWRVKLALSFDATSIAQHIDDYLDFCAEQRAGGLIATQTGATDLYEGFFFWDAV